MYNHTQPQGKCLRNSTDATVVLLIERNRDRYRKWLVRRDSLIWLWEIVTVEGRCDVSRCLYLEEVRTCQAESFSGLVREMEV